MIANVVDRIWKNYRDCDENTWLTVYPEGSKECETYTYKQVIDRAKSWADLYSRRGIKSGDSILLSFPTSVDLYASHIGALLLGVIPTIFTFPNIKTNKALFLESLLSSLQNYNYAAFVSTSDYAFADIIHSHIETITIEQLNLTSHAELNGVQYRDPVIHQYSSGTTGIKKRLPLTHDQLLSFIDCYYDFLRIDPQKDKVQSWLPLYHDMGFIACYMLPLLKKLPLVSLSAQDWVIEPQRFWQVCQQHQSNLIWQPNFAFGLYAKTVKPDDVYELSHIKHIISSSETTRKHSIESFFSKYRPFGIEWSKYANCFGLAEHTYAATQTPYHKGLSCVSLDKKALNDNRIVRITPDHPEGIKVISCGEPLPGVEVKIVTTDTTQVGDILLRSTFRFDGYSNKSLSQSHIDSDGWYNTRDCGFLLDNELFVLGRTDDIIICNGENYYPEDLEEIASNCDGVIPGRCAAIVSEQSQTETDIVTVFVELKTGANATKTTLLISTKIRATFSALVFHVALVEPKSLLKSSSGKISRKRVKQQFQNGQLTPIDTTPRKNVETSANKPKQLQPLSETQHKIYTCLQTVSESMLITRDCDVDLLDSGILDSLGFVSLIVQLEQSFSMRIDDLDTHAIEKFRSINSIADFIQHRQQGLNVSPRTKKTFSFEHVTPVIREHGVTPVTLQDAKVPFWFEDVKRFTDASVAERAVILGKGSAAAKSFISDTLNTDKNGFRLTKTGTEFSSLIDLETCLSPRVILLGASGLFGVGVRDEHTITSHLNRLNSSLRFFNAAVRSADLLTEMHVCSNLTLSPNDTVLSFSCGNDFMYFTDELDTKHVRSEQGLTQQEVKQHYETFQQQLFDKLLKYRKLVHSKKHARFLLSLQIMRPFCSPLFDVNEHQFYESMRAPLGWRVYRRNYRAIHFFWTLQQNFRNDLAYFCSNNQIDYLDPNPDFIAPGEPLVFEDFWHYTNYGSERIASLLLEFIQATLPQKATTKNLFNESNGLE